MSKRRRRPNLVNDLNNQLIDNVCRALPIVLIMLIGMCALLYYVMMQGV